MATLILALSGRALAQSARRAGAEVVVADLFGDADTRSLAPWHRLPGSLEDGIDGRALPEWVRRLGEGIDGIVYGAGFEAAPEVLGELACIAPLFGNPPEVVAAVKDPFGFAAVLRGLGLPHPEIAHFPRSPAHWLRKRRGGSGGAHIAAAPMSSPLADTAHYFQAFAPGRPISALFVANGRASRVLGLSAQWTSPTSAQPFRYGGCAGPVHLSPKLAGGIEASCHAIAAATGLVGLNSLDMLIADETFTILEVNPRPGATLDVFDDWQSKPLWDCHMRGLRGYLPGEIAVVSGARAAMVVYADQARHVPAGFTWEEGVADIPPPDSSIAAGMPVCTVIAVAPDVDAARALAERRATTILHRLPPLLRRSA